MIAVFHRRRFHALQVRAGTRLRHGNGANHFAAGQFGQIMIFQLVGAVVEHVRCNNVRVQAPAYARQAGPGYLFDQHRAIPEIRANTAKLFRQAWAKEAQLTSFLPELAANLAVFLPLIMVRRCLLLQELADRIAKAFKVGVEESAWNHGEPR